MNGTGLMKYSRLFRIPSEVARSRDLLSRQTSSSQHECFSLLLSSRHLYLQGYSVHRSREYVRRGTRLSSFIGIHRHELFGSTRALRRVLVLHRFARTDNEITMFREPAPCIVDRRRFRLDFRRSHHLDVAKRNDSYCYFIIQKF